METAQVQKHECLMFFLISITLKNYISMAKNAEQLETQKEKRWIEEMHNTDRRNKL